MIKDKEWGLHWFRRDLRIAGNESLQKNTNFTSGRTLGIFCFDSQFLSRKDFSHNRFAFFLQTLLQLKKDMQVRGGDLLIVDEAPAKAFSQLTQYLKKNNKPLPKLVTWSRDYEPFAQTRDQHIEEYLKSLNVPVSTERDHLLFEPQEILKNKAPDSYYQVFTPYSKKWVQALQSPLGKARLALQPDLTSSLKNSKPLFSMSWKDLGSIPYKDALESFIKQNKPYVTVPIPTAGPKEAYRHLQIFKDKIENYKEDRDFPSVAGTSRLSIFLKNGSLTVPQVIKELELQKVQIERDSGKAQFLKELIWREFYYAILFHRPDVETQSFLPQYRKLKWQNNTSHFEAWKQGQTGFPIVDAGMRELKTTGWMHNRVRMIVASFLTKDLLIDWRWGEEHFMQYLLDGDLAANNGGWQWAASTGCDPQPYFRIFNPWLQGKKFDPEGEYIKKYIPELQEATPQEIHNEDKDRVKYGYLAPIVSHTAQRNQALKLYTPSKKG